MQEDPRPVGCWSAEAEPENLMDDTQIRAAIESSLAQAEPVQDKLARIKSRPLYQAAQEAYRRSIEGESAPLTRQEESEAIRARARARARQEKRLRELYGE